MARWWQMGFVLMAFAPFAEAMWPEGSVLFARAVLRPKAGAKVSGTLEFARLEGSLLLRAYLRDVPKGSHALIIHEKGDCETESPESLGNLYYPPGQNKAERALGDLGNLASIHGSEGPVELTVELPPDFKRWNDMVGLPLVLYDKPGHFSERTETKLGKRLACGVIEPFPSLTE